MIGLPDKKPWGFCGYGKRKGNEMKKTPLTDIKGYIKARLDTRVGAVAIANGNVFACRFKEAVEK